VLRVNEMFPTIQGEANWTGTPSTFIRLQGCPVGCHWCDTKHTWTVNEKKRISVDEMLTKEDNAPTWAEMNEMEVMAAVSTMGPRHFVITGGEPCIYDLFLLTANLKTLGSVQVETSGTHEVKVVPGTWVTVSPKIGMAGGLAVRGDAMQRADEIKFPVETAEDIERLEQLLKQHPANGRLVWLQPVSQGEEATALCLDACRRNRWRLSLQTHKYAGLR
jgi:7-carboxy-7-deazaguanine synthase